MSEQGELCVDFNNLSDEELVDDESLDLEKSSINKPTQNSEDTINQVTPDNYVMKINLDNIDDLCVHFDDLDLNNSQSYSSKSIDSKLDEKKNDCISCFGNSEQNTNNDNDNGHELDTKVKYLGLRKSKCDPIGMYKVNIKNAFIYPYRWDPYTGEILGTDLYGPLYFDPDLLIKTFYTNRLNNLWVNPSNDSNGYYEGYYDDALGIGDTFFVSGRGHFNEWYIFRLPIVDCYLSKDHNLQMITMGPKLTLEEVEKIDKLANIKPNNYKSIFGKPRPSLVEINKLYNTAISNKTENIGVNKEAVKKLIKMEG